MSIAELIQRQGEIIAQGQRERGRIYGQLIQSLGQIPQQTYGQILQQRAQARQDKLVDQQIASGEALTAERNQVTAQKVKDAAEADAVKKLFAQGVPSLPQLAAIVGPERATATLNGIAALHAGQAKSADELRQRVGSMAGGILALPEPMRGDAYAHVRQTLIAEVPPEQQAALSQQFPEQYDENLVKQAHIAAMTPDAQQAVLQPKLTEQDPTKNLVDPSGRIVVPAAAPAKPANAELKHGLVNGVEGSVYFDPLKRTLTDVKTGQLVTDFKERPPASAPNPNPPGDWTKTGDDFLKTIPAQYRTTVQKVANYEEDPAKVTTARSGERSTFMQWVNQVNPAYMQDEYANRAPTRKAFTTGTQGLQINAMNTAIGHLDLFSQVAAALDNGSFKPGNALWNKLKETFGDSAPTNFATLKEFLDGELGAIVKKGAATEGEMAAMREKAGGSSSPKQLQDFVKLAVPILGSKLNSLDYQYHQAMDRPDGTRDNFSALSPESKSILQKISGGGTRTQDVMQNGVKFRLTYDKDGKLINSEVIK